MVVAVPTRALQAHAAAPSERQPPRARKLALKRVARLEQRARTPSPPPFDADAAALPFAVYPNLCPGLSVEALTGEADFRRDDVVTASGALLPESRLTGWQSDVGASFHYSGKTMEPSGPLTPRVAAVRDALHQRFGVRYDSVLLNLYPCGASAMRFHSDPGQGVEWQEDTAVVSVGSERRFVFREIADHSRRWAYTLRGGDCVRMFADCQKRLQHAVLSEAGDVAPRVSLVFKLSRTQV